VGEPLGVALVELPDVLHLAVHPAHVGVERARVKKATPLVDQGQERRVDERDDVVRGEQHPDYVGIALQ
jgi:hypothetical protein